MPPKVILSLISILIASMLAGFLESSAFAFEASPTQDVSPQGASLSIPEVKHDDELTLLPMQLTTRSEKSFGQLAIGGEISALTLDAAQFLGTGIRCGFE